MEDIEFRFIDTNKQITDAWEKVFEGVPNVRVINDSIFNHPSDALVSPANSFGFMNGGIDFVISKNLGSAKFSGEPLIQANNFSSLKRKNLTSVTPLRFALKALILELNDSAFALVLLLSKKLSMPSR